MKIDNVEVRVISPRGERYTWSHDLPEQYMTITLVRIRTEEGAEGIGGVGNYTSFHSDRYTAETLRHLISLLPGLDPLLPEDVRNRLRPRVFPITPAALAAIDIALWDLWARLPSCPSTNSLVDLVIGSCLMLALLYCQTCRPISGLLTI